MQDLRGQIIAALRDFTSYLKSPRVSEGSWFHEA